MIHLRAWLTGEVRERIVECVTDQMTNADTEADEYRKKLAENEAKADEMYAWVRAILKHGEGER